MSWLSELSSFRIFLKRSNFTGGAGSDQFDGRVWSSSEVQPYAPIGRVLDVRLEEKVLSRDTKLSSSQQKRWAFTLDDSVPASNNIELSPEGLIRFQAERFPAYFVSGRH